MSIIKSNGLLRFALLFNSVILFRSRSANAALFLYKLFILFVDHIKLLGSLHAIRGSLISGLRIIIRIYLTAFIFIFISIELFYFFFLNPIRVHVWINYKFGLVQVRINQKKFWVWSQKLTSLVFAYVPIRKCFVSMYSIKRINYHIKVNILYTL